MARVVAYLALASCSLACDGAAAPRVTIVAAPLELRGVGFVCYDLEVHNDLEQRVWSRGTALAEGADPSVCSSRYGNTEGGDITYVGTCDATDADANDAGVALNRVTVRVDGLYDASGGRDLGDYVNPCPWPEGCSLEFSCVENEDVRVSFDLTLMRAAGQGFFDMAVAFDDVFCSAKVDCVGDGGPLTLVFDPQTQERGQTVVLGLACTGGPATSPADTNDTVLLRDPIIVDCDGVQTVLDPTLGPGNVYGPVMDDPDPTDAVWQYMTFAGDETLSCGGTSCEKRYWSVAIGFDPQARDCTIATAATAGAGDRIVAFTTPQATYPWIDVALSLTHDAPGGGLACSSHPLNGGPPGVVTRYTASDDPKTFCHRFDGALSSAPACAQPARSCREIKVSRPDANDGTYLIDPDGLGGAAAIEVYCDMTTDGGGWTLIAQGRPSNDVLLSLCAPAAVASLDLDADTISGPAKLDNAVINAIWDSGTERKVLMKADHDGYAATTALWDRGCVMDFRPDFQWKTDNTVVLSDLETTSYTCPIGTMGDGVFDSLHPLPYYVGITCGFGFRDGPSEDYAIFTMNAAYNQPPCGGIAGRSWLGAANQGCSLSKTFVR